MDKEKAVRSDWTTLHVWRISIGHNTLAENHLLGYNEHMVDENDQPNLSKQLKGNITCAQLGNFLIKWGRSIARLQNNSPQIIIPLPHEVPTSHTNCQPWDHGI